MSLNICNTNTNIIVFMSCRADVLVAQNLLKIKFKAWEKPQLEPTVQCMTVVTLSEPY